jgi:hypothetical protein
MKQNQLIRCIDCAQIFFKTPYDQTPEYSFSKKRSPGSFWATEKDDFQDFLKDHGKHRLEELKVIEDSFMSEQDYLEPVKTSYFRATNGEEQFVIKKFRKKIGQPLTYQLINGDVSLRCAAIKTQSKEIAKQLEKELKTRPIPQIKIAAFLKLYRHIAGTIDPGHLERVLEESSNPVEIYYKLDDTGVSYLLERCHQLFRGQEYSDIQAFIYRHKDEGVLLLKGIYKIQITERKDAMPRMASVSLA